MSILGNIISSLFGAGLSQVFGLSRAEREQNEFNANQAEINRNFQAEQADKQNAFNAEQAQINRDFQAEQAATQWQRGVADMKAAGINPALAFGQGGASAMQGASASASGLPSGSAASGSGRGIAMSFSDMLQLATLPQQLKVLDAQAEDTKASAELKRHQSTAQQLANEWLPRRYASEIGLNESTIEVQAAEVERILQSARGQQLANEWNPRLWAMQLRQGEVDREATIVGIQKALQEIENLRSENANIIEDTRVKAMTQGLIAAQTALANQNSRDVSASAWRKEFENQYTKMYGHKPDEPVWNAVTSLISMNAKDINERLTNSVSYTSKRVKDTRNYVVAKAYQGMNALLGN